MLNGNVSRRIASLSDDSAFTDLALRDQSVEALVEATFLRILTRRPTPEEAQTFARMLADGYADRHWVLGEGTIPFAPIFSALGRLGSNPRLIVEINDFSRVRDSVAHLAGLGLAQ